ncbi:MAG TPA: winged helix-turn-helix domain-containing protein, partial [Methanocorpusculum sp.]|nr:winged helix-turn-helix domain-containing protein [Methanocorpusculum sp.]
EDRSLEFMKHLIQQERPQKIFRTIMNTPGITQKELAETTDIPTTTLQWHLTQLAKYEAITTSRRKNTISYTVLPEYIWLYHHLTKETETTSTAE